MKMHRPRGRSGGESALEKGNRPLFRDQTILVSAEMTLQTRKPGISSGIRIESFAGSSASSGEKPLRRVCPVAVTRGIQEGATAKNVPAFITRATVAATRGGRRSTLREVLTITRIA